MNIAVVALGKMGLPVAAWYASRGHFVTGCDLDLAVVAAVSHGQSPITHEPGLPELVGDLVAAGRLHATTDTAAGVRDAEAVIVLAPLAVDADHRPDYRALDEAFDAIGRGVRRGALIVLETTVAVGDTRGRFLPTLERGGGTLGRDFFLAFSPERVQSGTVFRDLTAYPRVVGGVDAESGRRAAAFYRENFGVEARLLPDAESAEFCKIAESVYRDVNIALANELAMYAEACGVDVGTVFPVANSQPQSHLHSPGVGVGGHCIPVYPYLLIDRTPHSALAAAARDINDAMPAHAAAMLASKLGDLAGRRVLILGVSYRAGVKEASHSPAIDLARELASYGAVPLAHDPLYEAEELRALGLDPVPLDPPPAVDAIVLQAAHAPYRTLDFGRFPDLRVVLDGRGALDPGVVPPGVTYLAIGRGTDPPAPSLEGGGASVGDSAEDPGLPRNGWSGAIDQAPASHAQAVLPLPLRAIRGESKGSPQTNQGRGGRSAGGDGRKDGSP